jgi:hypothetical protein
MLMTYWTNKHIASTSKRQDFFLPWTTTRSLAKPELLSRYFRKISTPAGVVEDEEEFHLEKLKMFGIASVQQFQLSGCFFHEFKEPFRL